MPPDDDADDESRFQPPLPPEDRLWRHPSEVESGEPQRERIVLINRPSGGRVVAAGVMGVLVGSVLAVGTLAAVGAFDGPGTSTAVERMTMPLERVEADDELAAAEKALPAIARVDATGPNGDRAATAVAVRDDGHLLTTSDVVDGAKNITVTLEDGSTHSAELVGRDRDSDLAVIEVNAEGMEVAAIPDGRLDQTIEFGDQVLLIDAAPPDGPGPVMVRGYVSYASRLVESDSADPMFGMIQIDVEPRRTDSSYGAVLIDRYGSLVGIVTARASGAGAETSQQVAVDAATTLATHFATPFDHAKQVFYEVVDGGSYSYPKLGVSGHDLTSAEAERLGVRSGAGLLLQGTEGDSPAQHAGLRRGDVITEVGRTPVASMNDLRIELRRHAPGDEVELTVIRHGQAEMVSVTLEADATVP